MHTPAYGALGRIGGRGHGLVCKTRDRAGMEPANKWVPGLAKIVSGVPWHEDAQVPGSSDGLRSADPGVASPDAPADGHEPDAADRSHRLQQNLEEAAPGAHPPPEHPEETVGKVAGQIKETCRELASLLEGHCRTVREKDDKIRVDGAKVPLLCCSACKRADGSRGI
jgi:hypothetical protein